MAKLDFKKINIQTDSKPIENLNLGCISPDDADMLAIEEPKEDENNFYM